MTRNLRARSVASLALVAAWTFVTLPAEALGVPVSNDQCTNAIPVAVPSSTPGSTLNASIDSAAGTCGTSIDAPGIWYSVTGTGHTLLASTCGTANYDTKINVYCGDCSADLGNLVCVGGNDDGPGCAGFTSEFAWCSQIGTEYLILVQGFAGATGNFTLTLTDDGVACVPDVSCGAPVDPISAFCFGTAPAPCNCGNHGADGNGCANGVYPAGANLLAVVPDPAFGPVTPSLTMLASGMTPLSLCILLQGTETAGGGTGVPFGDGLLCVGGSLMRLGVRPTYLGSTRFQVMTPMDFVSVGTLYYQVIYVTPGMFDICGAQGRNLNSTNGVRVDWHL